MSNKKILLNNKNKIHTTLMGEARIKRNLKIESDVVNYCIRKLEDNRSEVAKVGKNYYVKIDNITITINAYSYTIITAHKK